MPQLACHNPEINQRTGEMMIMMKCPEECRKQWRLKQEKLGQQKQKKEEKKEEEGKKQEEREQKKEEKKKKKQKKDRIIEVKKVAEEWEIWDKEEKQQNLKKRPGN